MNQIKLKYKEMYQPEDVSPLHEIDLNRIIVAKQNWKFLPIKYI